MLYLNRIAAGLLAVGALASAGCSYGRHGDDDVRYRQASYREAREYPRHDNNDRIDLQLERRDREERLDRR